MPCRYSEDQLAEMAAFYDEHGAVKLPGLVEPEWVYKVLGAIDSAAAASTGPGRVQAPVGTVHVLRQVGASLVYYRWLPGAIIDPDTVKVEPALETLGIAIPVPR